MSRIARKTRVVSSRELSRRMWSLMDEMGTDEVALIVLRYGRPAAMFIPFEESGTRVTLPRISDVGLPSDQIECDQEGEDDVELDDDQIWVLRDMHRCEDGWTFERLYGDRSRAMNLLGAVTRLELERLVERTMYGAVLTRKGRRVAARLDSTE